MPTVPSLTSDLPRSGVRVVMDPAWASPSPATEPTPGHAI